MGAAERMLVEDSTMAHVSELATGPADRIVLRSASGEDREVPEDVRAMLVDALARLLEHGSVTVTRVPDELTSTVAADLLGVSRPTLMKWADRGEIPSHTAGTHRRFRRTDVLELKAKRDGERRAAIAELLEHDAAHADAFDE